MGLMGWFKSSKGLGFRLGCHCSNLHVSWLKCCWCLAWSSQAAGVHRKSDQLTQVAFTAGHHRASILLPLLRNSKQRTPGLDSIVVERHSHRCQACLRRCCHCRRCTLCRTLASAGLRVSSCKEFEGFGGFLVKEGRGVEWGRWARWEIRVWVLRAE